MLEVLIATALLGLFFSFSAKLYSALTHSIQRSTQFEDSLLTAQSYLETALSPNPLPPNENVQITPYNTTHQKLTYTLSDHHQLEVFIPIE